MSLKRLFFIGYGLLGLSITSPAQNADFCTEINKIVTDGVTRFKNTRGEQLSVDETGITWASKVDVPGVIKARFVSAMGLFYEGAVFQTKDINEVGPVYDKYRELLMDCLLNKGYKMSLTDNYYPGLSAYKKLIMMKADNSDVAMPPPHVSMEVTYYKPGRLYTVVIYIYEH